MLRIEDSLVETCENGFSCGSESPDVPMNPYFLYKLKWPRFLRKLLRLFSPGLLNQDEFVNFGYGRTKANEKGDLELRKGVYRNIHSGEYNGGQYWVSTWINRLMFDDPARWCLGDSGSPLLFRSYNDSHFAITGIASGGRKCSSRFGEQFAYRFDDKTADFIQAKVESTGGSCERTEMEGDRLLQCFNP
jgi:hypothetical protein